jgi:hypothetical protein
MTRDVLLWLSLAGLFAAYCAAGLGPSSGNHFDELPMTSGLRPGADIVSTGRHVSNVPEPGRDVNLLTFPIH